MKPGIVVHGLGYVGLTAAVHFARQGVYVLGYDPDPKVVDAFNSGKPRAEEFLSYMNFSMEGARPFLSATNDRAEVLERGIHLIAVPTERAGVPDDSIVEEVLKFLFGVRADLCPPPATFNTIIIESTLTPGFVDRFMTAHPSVADDIARHRGSLAVCPRRDWFADPQKNLATLPRVVGGYTPECTKRATAMLSVVSPKILETDYRTAELVKALENALLHVPVMFAHQLTHAYPNHNVAEALRLASTHWRFESMGPLYLGFGTGGRCVPLGTEYLVKGALPYPPGVEGSLPIGEKALEADEYHRVYIAELVANILPGGARVLVLGIAYRPEFKDAGRSPGLAVANRMRKRGLDVWVHDPMWSAVELDSLTSLPVWEFTNYPLSHFSAVLLATAHHVYADLPAMLLAWAPGQVVLDGSGLWAPHRERFKKLGVRYKQVGEPGWMLP